MLEIVGIRFDNAGKIYNFSPASIDIGPGDLAVVETIRGVEIGRVVLGPRMIKKEDSVAPLKEIIRKATPEDEDQYQKNLDDAQAAIPICQEKIRKHKLEMRIINVEYTFDRNKFIVYFTAEGRVDFRELVRDLASVFRTRIELRQIGVRDEAKALGGIGSCGNRICCNNFLGDFEPVSIQMAKDQSLSLNPSKISGLCGRLMCCLNYESKVYEEKLRKMPELGTVVNTPSGKGTVIGKETLMEKVRVRVRTDKDMEDVMVFQVDDIKPTRERDSKFRHREEDQVDLKELSSLEE